MIRGSLLIGAALLGSAMAHGAEIVCEGVLGNSGEAGSTLVRYAAEPARGMGVVFDRAGRLWDRAGSGVLNRYALDGRLLDQLRIPPGQSEQDQLTLVGNTVVILVKGRLFTLPVQAAAGAEAKPLAREADAISFGHANGWIATRLKDDVSLFNPPTGEVKPIATIQGAREIELAPDGAVYVVAGGKLRKFVEGAEVTDGWPKARPGESPQLLDGHWFGNAWHTTIRRYTAAMRPAPGVCLGGSSGSFIGHLDQNGELYMARGLARVRDGLFAASSVRGPLHLLSWGGERQQFTIIRRLGAVPICRGLGLDAAGRVWHFAGAWEWNDRPESPQRFGINPPEPPGIGQAAMLDDGTLVAPGNQWGKPALFVGKLDREVAIQRLEKPTTLPLQNTRGTVIYRRANRLLLLVLGPDGAANSFQIGSDGRYQNDAGPVALKTTTPVQAWTSLAMRGPTTLLAAGDGTVVEFEPDGAADWKETRRWNSWGAGAAEKFGAAIHLTTSTQHLWITDRDRHRVLVFENSERPPIAVFGQLDQAGATLGNSALIDSPETIAASGDRAVVHDRANQRLIKLRLR